MVYRPPKNKPIPGSAPSPSGTAALANSTPKTGAAAGVLPGDDRHLVAVDESYAGGDLEDRLWLFWRNHRNKVYGVICVISAVIILWQGWRIYQAHVEASLQGEFAAATDAPALTAFAQAHPDATLGKLAQLEAADTLYKDGKFKEATDAYVKASTMLGDDEKSGRARLGQAMAVLQAGDAKTSAQLLEALTNDSTVVENLRAEATYYLAILAVQAGDNDGATKWLNHLKEFKESNVWSSQAATIAEILPLLSDVKIVAGSAAPAPKIPALTVTSTAAAPAAPAKPVATTAAPMSAPASTPASAPKPAPAPAPASSSSSSLFAPPTLAPLK